MVNNPVETINPLIDAIITPKLIIFDLSFSRKKKKVKFIILKKKKKKKHFYVNNVYYLH